MSPLKKVLTWHETFPYMADEKGAFEAELRPERKALVSISHYVDETFEVLVTRKHRGEFGPYVSRRLRPCPLKDAIVMQYLIWRSTCDRR